MSGQGPHRGSLHFGKEKELSLLKLNFVSIAHHFPFKFPIAIHIRLPPALNFFFSPSLNNRNSPPLNRLPPMGLSPNFHGSTNVTTHQTVSSSFLS